MISEKALFIFDVDGTLVNAYPAIEASLNFTRLQLGYSRVSLMKVKRSVGRGDENFIKAFFSAKDNLQALRIYRRHHKKVLLDLCSLRPGAREVLEALKRKGKIICVASNRPLRFTEILLKKLKIKKYFNAVYCADKIKSLKPAPKILLVILKHFKKTRRQTVYIGDMDIDLETARRARVEAVFIKGGSSTLGQVSGYRNKKVISKLEEILKLYA
ncbi:MAG: HAD family hydrolase [Candidatus Omnitrophica bacterium]|nr:HAD family hydrolase [Candidatus Omnitrophota bacterium]MDD5430273.1 HAD family hydrolase [Candidatus Omnitrophota bacterium]